MLNNSRNDGTQYLLTAHHCLTPFIENDVAGFNFQVPDCSNSPTPSIGDSMSVNGFKLVGIH